LVNILYDSMYGRNVIAHWLIFYTAVCMECHSSLVNILYDSMYGMS
jgi:hypothetical protein